jgi:CRISPR-associated protein Cmr1
MGVLTLKLSGDAEMVGLLAWLLLFLEKWGNLGAKPQLGYGVFRIENRKEVLQAAQQWDWQHIKEKIHKRPSSQSDKRKGQNLPNLRQFGFFRYRINHPPPAWWTRVPGIERVASRVQPLVRNYNTVPVCPALKNEWRFHQWRGQKRDAFEIFGTLRPNRQRSKVAVSWAYRLNKNTWEIRGWVWLASPRWAEAVWRIISDEAIWGRVLRVDGRLETFRWQNRHLLLQTLQEALS